jgi:hypothetical protein
MKMENAPEASRKSFAGLLTDVCRLAANLLKVGSETAPYAMHSHVRSEKSPPIRRSRVKVTASTIRMLHTRRETAAVTVRVIPSTPGSCQILAPLVDQAPTGPYYGACARIDAAAPDCPVLVHGEGFEITATVCTVAGYGGRVGFGGIARTRPGWGRHRFDWFAGREPARARNTFGTRAYPNVVTQPPSALPDLWRVAILPRGGLR